MRRVVFAAFAALTLAGLVGVLPAAAAVKHRVLPVSLSRTTKTGGCCFLQVTRLTSDYVTVRDQQTQFSATAGHVQLGRSRYTGYMILWMYVIERNEQSVAVTLMSGPNNWLLEGSDGVDHGAYPGTPNRHRGGPLAHVDALSADTNPTNQGWIWFRIPAKADTHYTLAWDDCRLRCNPASGRSSFSPVADLTIAAVPPTQR